jgi:actin-binding LIM protein
MFAAVNSRSSGKFTLNKASSKSGMKVLVDSIRTEMPRPKSPHMNNEEPIELAHFPAAKRPGPGEKPKIERDDFPAPPYPYTDPGGCAQNCIFYHTLHYSRTLEYAANQIFNLNPLELTIM